jgi:D-serine deaminase-like pyridoxal phosphate-dependent protein
MDGMVNSDLREAAERIEATPAVLIDLPVVERNVRKLAEYARAHGIGVRPHTKTHKSIRMARMQVEHGAVGLTAAKVGEAEAMAEASQDVLIAYPAIDSHRLRRACELARRGVTVRMALDSVAAAGRVAEAAQAEGVMIGIMVDLDVGVHRTGVQSPAAALELARFVDRSNGVSLDGLFFYPGHVWAPAERQAEALGEVERSLAETIGLWRGAGLNAGIVCGGSTPTAYQSHLVPSGTEIRPGTYLYNDMNTARAGFCTLDGCAARVICTVVSDAVPDKVVVDAGTKTLTSDRNVTRPDAGHGHVVEYPDAGVVRLSEEHGELDVSMYDRRPRVGERVSIIPNHICPCVNLQDAVWVRSGDGHVERWPVDARGRLS